MKIDIIYSIFTHNMKYSRKANVIHRCRFVVLVFVLEKQQQHLIEYKQNSQKQLTLSSIMLGQTTGKTIK